MSASPRVNRGSAAKETLRCEKHLASVARDRWTKEAEGRIPDLGRAGAPLDWRGRMDLLRYELYDLSADPLELDSRIHSTVTVPGYEATRAEMAEKLAVLKTCAGQGCRDAEDAP